MAEASAVAPETPARQVESEALTVVHAAKAITIKDQQSYDLACSFLTGKIKPMLKRVAETFEPMQKKAHAAWKEIVAQRTKIEEPLTKAEAIIKSSIVQFQAEQERVRQEQQRKLEEEQRKLEEEAKLAAAIQMEESGAEEADVEAILTEASVLPTPVAAPTFQRASGVSSREVWSAEVVSLKELCGAVFRGEAPESYVEANMPSLNALARAQKTAMNLKGVKAVCKQSISGRAL